MDDISIIKPNELENYTKDISSHDFFELFPSDKYTFDQNKYQYYFYFGSKEAQKYLQDYMTFCARTYPQKPFDTQNYFAVWEEFCKYLDKENVFVFYKTKIGAFYLNRTVDTKEYLIRDRFLQANGYPQMLSNKYYFPYFRYLEKKLKESTKVDSLTVERLLPEDLMYMQEIYMGRIKLDSLPFFLDEKNKSYKFARSFVVNNILPMTTDERSYLLANDTEIVGLAYASPISGDAVTISIMTDIDYMDSSFGEYLNLIKSLYKGRCQKIVVKNPNRSIASSNLNTACILAHFKVDYDHFSSVDGYTQYDHIFKYNDEEDVLDFVPMTTPQLISTYK